MCLKFTNKSIKIYQVVINLIWLCSGLTYIIIGILNFLSAQKMAEAILLKELNLTASSIITMCLGLVIIPVVIYGAYRSYEDGHFISKTYAMTFVLLILIQVTIGFVLYLDQKSEVTTKRITEDFNAYFKDNSGVIQEKLQCCGIENYYPWDIMKLPKSCCFRKNVDGCTVKEAYFKGCLAVLLNTIKGQKQGLLYLTVGFAFLHILNLINACAIAKGTQNKLI